jgi:hypothetical protein
MNKATISHLRLVVPAALLAASTVQGGGALGNPATASGKPTDAEVRNRFEGCARRSDNAYLDGVITSSSGKTTWSGAA